MKRILLLVVVLILYGSFYPWSFHARALPASPLWMLLHSWPAAFDRSDGRDAVVNFSLYAPFGMFCFLSLSDSRSRAFRSIATFFAAALLSSSVEMAQLFDVGRMCSLFDVLCNTGGAAVGILLASTFPRAIAGVVSEAEAVGVFRLSGVVALLYLWAGYQLFPFFPVLGPYVVRLKLAVLLSSRTWPLRDFFESFSGWLAASTLFESLLGRRRTLRILPMALLVIPLKLLIAQRTMTGSEMAGALAGAGSWMILRRLGPLGLPRAGPGTGVLALAALVAAGLAPFHFAGQPQSLTWVPFLPLLETPWESAFLILLQKSFLYGAAVWLLKEPGRGWMSSSLLVAIPLAIVEAAQIFLPGRTPEVTDPLLAILLGCSLMLLERHARRQRPERLLAGF